MSVSFKDTKLDDQGRADIFAKDFFGGIVEFTKNNNANVKINAHQYQRDGHSDADVTSMENLLTNIRKEFSGKVIDLPAVEIPKNAQGKPFANSAEATEKLTHYLNANKIAFDKIEVNVPAAGEDYSPSISIYPSKAKSIWGDIREERPIQLQFNEATGQIVSIKTEPYEKERLADCLKIHEAVFKLAETGGLNFVPAVTQPQAKTGAGLNN